MATQMRPSRPAHDQDGAAAFDVATAIKQPLAGTAALSALSLLATTPTEAVSTATLVAACNLIRDALGAGECYVVRSGDPYFTRVDEPGDPRFYEVKQKGYYLTWRTLISSPQLAGGVFDVAEGRITNPHTLRPGVPSTHLATLLPSDESNAEILIARGPWPAGLSTAHVEFVVAARLILAHLVNALLDTQRRERQREQLRSISTIAHVLTQDLELEAALPAIATAVARASGFDWVTVSLVNDAVDRVTASVLNISRYSETAIATSQRVDQAPLARALCAARQVRGTGRPLLYPDIFSDDPGDTAGLSEYDLLRQDPEVRRYNERAHLLSSAVFPVSSGERFYGTLSFTSSTKQSFAPAQVEFLTLLSEQAALALQGLKLHSDLRDANAALAHTATHDALTGLPNRTLLLDRLTQALARARRSRTTVAVIFADLDNFKSVNDTLGHDVGDRLLQGVAERLSSCLRAGDTAARFGGDEFTLVLESLDDEAEAGLVAARLQAALREPISVDGHLLVASASIGIACDTAGTVGAEGLISRADLAMYQAKAQGKDRLSSYQRSMTTVVVERQKLEQELREAITGGQFRVHYQPIMELQHERLVGLEALVRWQHPEHGMLSPDTFIPLAEETGLIVPLGLWVLREACRQTVCWQERWPQQQLEISVNLSARQFQQPSLVDDVAAVLAETGLPPAQLRLELTESTLMKDADGARAMLQRLKQMGVQLAIDDFGTGYSSLSYLKCFPVDTLKVDRSFIDGVVDDPQDAAIVEGILALARSLNLSVTAEGIELPEQFTHLRALGCEQGQGYLFARPLDVAAIETLLAQLAEQGRGRAA